jgi:hypothetical protein
MLRRILSRQIAFFFPLAAFAGQSLVLNGSSNISVVDPVLPWNQSWRIEFQIHNWTPTPAGVYSAQLFNLIGTGAIARVYPGGTLETESSDQFAQGQPCFVGTNGLTNALVRMQKNVQAMLFTCEIWNYDGTGYSNQVMNISKLVPRSGSGGTLGPGATAAIGFLRVSTTLLPLGAKPPTTADGGNWTEWKFDGNLTDSSGNNHNASGSVVSYMATPNQVAVANPKTLGAPVWSNWVSLRAGYPAQLDGSASYSLADASSSVVSFRWQESNGPSTVIWTNQHAATPTLNGLIFGTYDFSLEVTDTAGSKATARLAVGAVATDDNGVVVNADPNVDKIFGPMIAFGRNPWGYADERAISATRLRMAAYNAQGYNPPSWATPLPGTVTYFFNGAGLAGAPATKLSSAVTSAATTISVADASPLDLSSLPARILLGSSLPREEVRICGASASKGPATLTVCYDGRGQSSPVDGYRAAAQAWPAGTLVGQMKVTGAGTAFLTTICPTGPGPTGTPVYKSGSVQVTPGSTSVVGSRTTWNVANGVLAGNLVRVSATHGGAPFVFVAYIASVADPAHLTLARPWPSDADSGSFSYSIVRADYRQLTLHYKRPADGSDQQLYFQTTACESDTDAYLYGGHDIASLNGSLQRSVKYGYLDGFGYTSAFGPNFYGEDLAHRALYYRSGWTPALQAARVFGDNYVKSPLLGGGETAGIPLLTGAGIIAGFAAAILDTSDSHRPSWNDLRGFARSGSIGGSTCNDWDTRDSGYLGAWLSLAAEFDPDPVQRAHWQTELRQLLVRDRKCKGPDNSWAHGYLWGNAGAPLAVTHGSAVATGSGIPPTMCFGIAGGTMSVVNGSATGMGAGFVKGNKIAVTGTMKGAPYTGFFQFIINKNGTITMAALWPGDSGTATFVIENNDFSTTIATSNNDPQMSKNWACTWNNSSQITLNRPWDGPTETGAHAYSNVLAGFGQQPFMLGVHITAMKFASQNADSAISTGYAELIKQAAAWIHDTGYDPVTQGMHYGRIMEACEPLTIPPPSPAFAARTPGCNYGLDPGAIRAARVLTAEASQALRVYYESNPTPEAKAWGDRAYGSIWGNPAFTTGGVYSDSKYVRDENSDGSLGAYKWTGFFFGMGMAHQWPAVRMGGVAPAANRKVSIDVKRGLAAKTQISVTAPSGKVSIFACGPASASSCEVTVDDRQGSHWYRVQYLSEDGKVASQSDPALIGRLRALQQLD